MQHINLFVWEAEALYELLISKFKENCKSKNIDWKIWINNKTVLTGFNQSAREKDQSNTEPQEKTSSKKVKSYPDSLFKLIRDHDGVKEYLTNYLSEYNSTKQDIEVSKDCLYKLVSFIGGNENKFSKAKSKYYDMLEHYANALYIYLGFEGREDFLKRYTEEIHYKGYYYSALNMCVQEFNLAISKQSYFENTSFISDAKVSGFHNASPPITLMLAEPAERIGKSIGLKFNFQDYFLTLQLHFGGEPIDSSTIANFECLFGAISGNTVLGFLCSVEVLFLKEKSKNELNDIDLKKYEEDKEKKIKEISRYLYIRRNNFSTDVADGKVLYNLRELKINTIKIKDVSLLAAKTFRIFNFDLDGGIVQSKFIIYDNYSAEIFVPGIMENDESMKCFLSVNNMSDMRLLVYAYRERNILYSTTVFEVPERLDGSKTIMNGAFCVFGRGYPPVGDIFVMCLDATDFKPSKISKNKIKKVLFEDQVGQNLYDHLMNRMKNRYRYKL